MWPDALTVAIKDSIPAAVEPKLAGCKSAVLTTMPWLLLGLIARNMSRLNKKSKVVFRVNSLRNNDDVIEI